MDDKEEIKTQGPEAEEVALSKDKIDQVLDSFLREQEQAKERAQQKQQKIKKEKQKKKIRRALVIAGIALFVLVIVASNPNTQQYYNKYKEAQIPKEEYDIEYNYASGMEILPMGTNLLTYDSGNLKLLKKNGQEIFDIPFMVGSWDLATSDKAIYLLDKIDKILYFIDEKGNFVNKVVLTNNPHKLYAGKQGNLALHYRSESGVEGVCIYDKDGKLLTDVTYPKTTLTMVHVNDENKVTVHGMLRIASTIENSVYRYSERGNLIFSKSYQDVIYVRQYEDKSQIIYVDVNTAQFYNKNINEDFKAVTSIIPTKLVTFDEYKKELYLLDTRNRLRILDMDGNLVEEKYFQIEYKQLLIYKGELLMIGDDFIRTQSKEIKMDTKIEKIFKLGDYLVIVTQGRIRLLNKLI